MSGGKNDKAGKERDFIRSTFRALNIQAVLALVMFIFIPYVILFHYLGAWWSDMNDLAGDYAEQIYADFYRDPSREHARLLAAEHEIVIGFEGEDGLWYTDGESVTEITPDMKRPYYRGLYRYYDTPHGERVVISWPVEFLLPEIHFRIFLTWVGAPIAFFLMLFYLSRRTLYPIRWVQSGINEVASGNLQYQAPVTGKDKKNTLAKRFNAMTASIRELIHSKDQLIMDVSHELRSPITRIKVALEMLQQDATKEDAEKIGTVQKNVHELEDIISTILESQRINLQSLETEISRCRLAEIIRECVELQKSAAPGFDLKGLDNTVTVDGDRALLKLLVHNLLDNAVKYSTEDSAPVKVSLQSRDGSAVLQITDDGIGIDENHINRVFDPFYKVARERGFNTGYGLGLSLCKRIVELHGGEISLENNTPRGLEVTVALQLSADQPRK